MKTVWMICKGADGKFYDGFYGADCNIHSSEQIFNQDNVPYYIDSDFVNIVVGLGEIKPSVCAVQELLIKMGEI